MTKRLILATMAIAAMAMFALACGSAPPDNESPAAAPTEAPATAAAQPAEQPGQAESAPTEAPATSALPALPAPATGSGSGGSAVSGGDADADQSQGGTFNRLWADPPTLDPHKTSDTRSAGLVSN